VDFQALPKIDLHRHLEGSVRFETFVELAREVKLGLSRAELRRQTCMSGEKPGFLRFMSKFEIYRGIYPSREWIERVAFEAAEDARADGCVLAEFRIAPTLFEPHGIRAEAAIEALLTGLRRSALPSGLILCAMRERSAEEAARAVRLAQRYLGQGVVAFDLAGAELGHPPAEHASALQIARDAGVPLTIHAGEADEASRVIEAARLGARRIGHGVRLADALGRPDGARLIDEARERDLHLELCPSSNVHTGAAASIATHPITALHRAGLSVSFHTDNQLMSRTTPAREAAALLRETPLTVTDLAAMALQAARHSFLDDAARSRAEAAIRAFASAIDQNAALN